MRKGDMLTEWMLLETALMWEGIEVMDEPSGEGGLPSPKELRGMDPDFTGEQTTVEYVRSLRE